ncbi:unnamed protein product, partial [Strongylus vulgaris]
MIASYCNHCRLEYSPPSCGLGNGAYSMIDFVRACAGQEIIIPEGQVMVIDASKISEIELLAFCSRAIYMEVCIVMTGTEYRRLQCPHLKQVKPCKSGMPIFTITRNQYLTAVDIPDKVRYPQHEKLFLVKENVRLPVKVIQRLKKMCTHCEIEGFFSKCSGLGRITNVAEFVKRCIGQPIISPGPNVVLEVDLSNVPEKQLNALFAEVVEMQMCVTISGSSVKKLSFPKLTRWLSCAPGKDPLTLTYNFELIFVEFPSCGRQCIQSATIRSNPKLPRAVIDIMVGYISRSVIEYYVPSCGLGIGGFTEIDFVRACAGKPYIKAEGIQMVIDAREVSEMEMNAFCSNAVYMEVCIVMTMTNYRSLRCPHLKYIKSCKPGTPAFTIVQNSYLSVIEIPPNVHYPKNEKILLVGMNRKIPSANIQ